MPLEVERWYDCVALDIIWRTSGPMTRVGILGTGHIAAPIARALATRSHSVTVSRRNESVSTRLAREYDSIRIADNQEVLDRSEVVILSLRAQVAREVLPHLAFRSDHALISVMAGVTLAELGKLCAPAIHICLTIPLSFIEAGACPLPVFPASAQLEALFGLENPVITVSSEAALAQHFAAATMVPVTLALLEEAAEWLGERTGDRGGAEIYIATLLAGALAELPKDGRGRFTEALHGLATEGGLSAQILNHLRDTGMLAALEEGLDGLGHRLESH